MHYWRGSVIKADQLQRKAKYDKYGQFPTPRFKTTPGLHCTARLGVILGWETGPESLHEVLDYALMP